MSKHSRQKWKEVVYGKDGIHSIPYLTRIRLLNSNPDRLFFKNGLFLHKFHRGDWDRAFHDHPWNFWTYPLHDYQEDVLTESGHIMTHCTVKAFQWHFREANHTHMIRTDQQFPIRTIVLPGVKNSITWGFYVTPEEHNRMAPGYTPEKTNRGNLWWIPWRKYTFEENISRMNSNQEDILFCAHCGDNIGQFVETTTHDIPHRTTTGFVIFRCTNCGLESKVHEGQLKPWFPNEVIDLTLENWWL